ncbi:CmpA/NrtA family ABC transporter substrate-binding protein [Paraglaciecola sp. L3A3]|uniref:CmpA/NrtA family ABC transporter substrate-binding protein n=1 Tax=Paraglaciecola sp. L3A3 TaxID=2686358 RepID=UPI00131A79AF|nr:CmpA/NrtA family ABC transporter substrate-binding protein [Paraglaciecola sp. L3A3]
MIKLEQTEFTLGFIPLTDSAPLVAAKEMGFFEKWGLDVKLQKQNSWATLRDKLHTGVLDAAQMLAPMPLASSLGVGCPKTAVITPLVLSLNGNGITLSQQLHNEILTENNINQITLPLAGYLLRSIIKKRKVQNRPKLRFATVFPYSCHFYQLRDWLSSAQITPDEVDIIVVPPVNMVGHLASDDIDGFCVGGPWNAQAVRAGIGFTALTSYDIWQDSPEKVLGILQAFYDEKPNTVLALLCALKEACIWLEDTPNRFEIARLLSQQQYLDAPVDVIAPSLIGSCLTDISSPPRAVPSYNQFYRTDDILINIPEHVRGEWLLSKMLNAGQLHNIEVPDDIVKTVFRPDIYEQMRVLLTAKN